MIITLNHKATLLRIKSAYGHTNEQEEAQQPIWCCAGLPSTSTKINAESVGIKADLIVHCYRKDYDKINPTHIDIDNIQYKIAATGSSINDLFVKLTVTRC